MRFFFITTDHLETRIWFRDDDDFKTGMNYVAVAAAKLGISVIAFILMSNHVHFLLLCREDEAKGFIDFFKKIYGSYYERKYGVKRALRRNGVDIRAISTYNEGVEKVIAYIIMNSVAARICLAPGNYRWGSGACYYNDNKEIGKQLSEYSKREQKRILKSKFELPGHWKIGAGDYVLPESYVRTDIVERVFSTPARMMYFIRTSSKAKKALAKEGISFRDQIMQEAVKDLLVSFGKKTLADLNHREQTELVSQLRWRFNADVHQISRVSGFTYSEVTGMLDSL